VEPPRWTTFTSTSPAPRASIPITKPRLAPRAVELRERTGLGVSVGAATQKWSPPIASRLQRPARLSHDRPRAKKNFLDAAARRKNSTASATSRSTLANVDCTSAAPPGAESRLQRLSAEAIGQQIWSGLAASTAAKCVLQRQIRFPETTIEGGTIDTEFLGGLIEYLSERIGSNPARIRQAGAHHRPGIRYVDHFSAHQTVRLTKPTNDERELLAAAKDLFIQTFHPPRGRSLVGVSVHNSKPITPAELLTPNANRRWYLTAASIPSRPHGWNAVFSATASSSATLRHQAQRPVSQPPACPMIYSENPCRSPIKRI